MRDIYPLIHNQCINDNVITYYSALLMDRNEKNASLPNIYTFNTIFYENLKKGGHAKVKRHTRKMDIFNFDLLFVPIHFQKSHWLMVCVNFSNQTVEKFDSYNEHNEPEAITNILNYLVEEHLQRKGFYLDTSNFTLIGNPESPKQGNSVDCGIFMLSTMEHLARHAPLNFSQDQMKQRRKSIAIEILSNHLIQPSS